MDILNCKHLVDWKDFEVLSDSSEVSNDPMSYYESYKKLKSIISDIPITELIKRGWISSKDDMASLVPLFQNIHSNKLTGFYRKAQSSNRSLCSLWQTRIATTAKLLIASNQIGDFQGLSKDDLKRIAKQSPDYSIVAELPQILSEMGIVVIYEKSLPGMKLDGVVFSLESGHPVVGISFRYKRLDNFWFTLLHELAHITLHYEALHEPIFDNLENYDIEEDLMEKQADRLAKYSFVEKYKLRNCKAKYTKNEEDVIAFAQQNNVHPAIVAGILQKETNSFNLYRKIVDSVDIREIIFGNE